MKNECWVTAVDHEQEKVEKDVIGLDSTIMKAIGLGVPTYSISPDDKVSNSFVDPMHLPSGRTVHLYE